MQNKLKNICLKLLLPLTFWLAAWQISAMIVSNSFLIPTIPDTMSALVDLVCKHSFYSAILLSLVRVVCSLALGVFIGVFLGFICHRFSAVTAIFQPIIKIVKSTPVASFILLLWVLMSGDMLAVFVGFLMVMPIIYQSTFSGLDSIDKQLSEVAAVFVFSAKRRLLLLTLPALKKHLPSAIITASGLAWKSVIAAEIIAYTKRSIGQGINDAKYNLDTPTVFAWTVVIILFSILLEWGVKKLMRGKENVA